jgi:hypothetical protein
MHHVYSVDSAFISEQNGFNDQAEQAEKGVGFKVSFRGDKIFVIQRKKVCPL